DWPHKEGVVCSMNAVFAVAAIGVGLTAVPLMAADGIQPGLWKITTVALNNGVRMPPQTNSRCLTAEPANDLAHGGMNTTFQRTQYAKCEQKLTWRLECRGQFNMDSAAEFTLFQSASLYGRHLNERLDIGDQQISDTQVTLEGEFVGACQ